MLSTGFQNMPVNELLLMLSVLRWGVGGAVGGAWKSCR